MSQQFHNVFLDFLNRDSRQIFGLFENVQPEAHIEALTRALNVAVLLCRENCICPVGFLSECGLARATVKRRRDFLFEGLIRLAIRESTIAEWHDKKRREYGQFRQKYLGLFEPSLVDFLKAFPDALIRRETVIGPTLVHDWEQAIDVDPFWKKVTAGKSYADIAIAQAVPKDLYQEGLAVVWPAIEQKLIDQISSSPAELRLLLQHQYFQIYLREYGLTVITGIPFSRFDFGVAHSTLEYDYRLLKAVATAAGVWEGLRSFSAPSIIGLRHRGDFWRFREAFEELGLRCGSIFAGTRAATFGGERTTSLGYDLPQYLKHQAFLTTSRGIDIKDAELDEIAYRLSVVATSAAKVINSEAKDLFVDRSEKSIASLSPNVVSRQRVQTVGVFVALREERLEIVKRWKLTNEEGSPYWRGNRNGRHIVLYSTSEMGRVPAAIITYRLLSEIKVDMLMVVGIAGGFAETGTELGDVLVPSSVIDLASRKMKEIKEELKPEFRSTEFLLDKRMIEFLDSSSFNRGEWEKEVIEIAEWPDGRRPTLRYERVASLDDVVASDKWRKALLDATPKLSGVEMEAGGICAAADKFQIRPCVLRGVSDLADPAKSDTRWRTIAIRTTANLIERFFDHSKY